MSDQIRDPAGVLDETGNVRDRLQGYTTGPTIWALRMQVKRDIEEGTDRQKLVPYGVVLAYAEKVGEEAVDYLNVKLERVENCLLATRIICGAIVVGAAGIVVATLSAGSV